MRAAHWLAALSLGLAACSGSCGSCGEPEFAPLSIAECIVADGDVRAHSSREVVWEAIDVGAPFAVGDWVRTAGGSRAQIRFHNGSELSMEEASTIVIEDPEAKGNDELGPMIALQGGVVRGSSRQSKSSRVTVKTPAGERVVLSAAEQGQAFDYRVKLRDGGEVEVAVTSGAARVQSGQKTSTLRAGEAQLLVAGSLSEDVLALPSAPEPAAPPDGAQIEVEDDQSVRLEWQPVDAAASYEVQVGADPAFRRVVASGTPSEATWSFSPTDSGVVYWRVATKNARGLSSEFGTTRRVDVRRIVIPRLLVAPEDGKVFESKRPPRIELVWKTMPGASEYVVVVSRDAGLAGKPIVEHRLSELRLETRALTKGTYYWGVYPVVNGQRVRGFKSARKIEVRRKGLRLKTPRKLDWN